MWISLNFDFSTSAWWWGARIWKWGFCLELGLLCIVFHIGRDED